MEFDRTGIILYTRKYEECVNFYGKIIELKILFQTKILTCFEFGKSYLMVEIDDAYDGIQHESDRIRTCLRMSVSDVKKRVNELLSKNIEVNYQEHSWGTVAKFFDPDGRKPLCV